MARPTIDQLREQIRGDVSTPQEAGYEEAASFGVLTNEAHGSSSRGPVV